MTLAEAEKNRAAAHAKHGTKPVTLATTWCDYYGTPFQGPDDARPFIGAVTRGQAEANVRALVEAWPDLLDERDQKIIERTRGLRLERLEDVVAELAALNNVTWPRIE